MEIDKCPHCGGKLDFNLLLRKYICRKCTAIWSYYINMTEGTVDWYEWFVSDKPDGWEQMSHEEQMCYLNIERLTQSAERFIRKEIEL